jgi:Photosynthesis system II assembly factor YCF48
MEQLPKIAQQRLRGTAKPGVHPDPDLLAGFAEKSLSDRERAHVLQHLAECADCRDVIALAMPEIESAPSPSPKESSWLSWPALRWGALAACVVVSAAVTLHYERRKSMEPVVAEKGLAPTPSETLTLQSQVAQPGQKLAAKISPPSPFQSDRDFVVAGKLAKQSDDMRARAAATPSLIDGLEPGQLGSLRRENNQMGKDERDRLMANRLASADQAQPVAKPPTPAGESSAVVFPASPPAARITDVRPQTKEWNHNLDSAVKASNETVTVEAESAPVTETSQTRERKAKDESLKNDSHKEVKAARAGAVGAASMGDRRSDTASLSLETAETVSHENDKRSNARNQPTPSWTLSADGALQRSFDSGKNWQTIPVASHVVFRALAANDSDVWVGGAAGALYHSSDAGQHWTQVKPVADGKPLTADIVTVEFSDPRHGKLTSSTHETWTTSDAGNTWQSR